MRLSITGKTHLSKNHKWTELYDCQKWGELFDRWKVALLSDRCDEARKRIERIDVRA